MKTILLLAFALVVPCQRAADDEGHHHEDLTEAQLGTVHFPSSCSAAVQKPVEGGVAMLHSFWYEEAEKEFEQIEKGDPQCAIAHWGVAMSLWHQLWNRPELAVLQRGGEQLKAAEHLHATAREKDYLKALEAFYQHPKRSYEKRAAAYSSAMQKVMQRNPDDHEAAAFYALSLLAADPDKDNTSRTKAAAVLEKLFAEEPQHPGVAHYLIHTYDKPDMAEKGLPAALSDFQVSHALELHHWSEAAQLSPVEGTSEGNRSFAYLARAIGAARSDNREQARKEVGQLEAIQKKAEANKKKEPWTYDAVSDELTIARAWIAHAEGRTDEAVRLLRPMADKDRGEAEASEGIPVHEIIDDMLLEAKRPADALVEYEATLKSDPGRFNALYGAAQASEQVGQSDKAREFYSQLLKNCDGSKSDRAELKHAREKMDVRAGK